MKRLYYGVLLVLSSITSFNCQKEISYALNGPGGQNDNGSASPLIATLQGNIIDESGAPAPGVTIRVGTKTAVTDDRGFFRILQAALDKNAAMVTAEKPGYFKAFRSFTATSGANHVMIKLVKRQSPGSVDAGSGGSVSLANGAKVALPANAVIKTTGGAYTGTVTVYAAYIDPTAHDIVQSIPGSLIADNKDNERVILSSFGMMAVELESANGEKLQVAPGMAATLTMPIPSSIQASAPASIPLWYIDEQKGIWKEEGMAVKNGNYYSGEVKHFSFWNCDIPFPAVRLSLRLETGKGVALANASVRLTGKVAGSVSQAYSYTDSLGQVSGFVPANEQLLLEVLDPCNNPVYNKKIGPLNANADLGNIVINNLSLPALVTIEGELKDCNNQPVTNGYAIVNCDNVSRYVSANGEGKFATSFVRCSGAASTCEITGVDNKTQQQGGATVINILPVTNAGTISACGISSYQFINYTIDGTDYSMNSAANDSLMAFTTETQSSPPLSTWFSGMKIAGNDYISLSFAHDAKSGTYPVTSFSVKSADSVVMLQPFNVVLTSYPAAAGAFYEGTFSGKFRGMSSPLPVRNVNGSFRLRRW